MSNKDPLHDAVAQYFREWQKGWEQSNMDPEMMQRVLDTSQSFYRLYTQMMEPQHESEREPKTPHQSEYDTLARLLHVTASSLSECREQIRDLEARIRAIESDKQSRSVSSP